MIGRAALVAGLAAGLAAAPAHATGVDLTCALALGKNDPSIRNVGFPDQEAGYWLGAYAAVPGTRIRIDGEFPHSRYLAFSVYDAAGRPLDSISDAALVPEPGSTNPFLAGADRTARHRRYTAWIVFDDPPAGRRAPNTIYAGRGQGDTPNVVGTILYRIYLPDHDTDERGGVGVPRLTLELPDGAATRLRLADCSEVALPKAGLTDELAGLGGLPKSGLAAPGHPEPVWRRFVNLPTAYADVLRDNGYADALGLRQVLDRLPLAALGGAGGFFSNLDNDYVYALISRNHGEVLEIEGRAPTFPDTRGGIAAFPAGRQLRYFSFCQNEILTTRFIACLPDDRLVVDPATGRYRLVLSTKAGRPATAQAACGVSWLPWGPSESGVLILRHMLPAPDFANAVQRIPRDATAGQVRATLGDYAPAGRYFHDRRAYEALGCRSMRAQRGRRSKAGRRHRSDRPRAALAQR